MLVNAGRGPIVDEDALVEAVEAREIHAAGLDVFEEEPPEGSPVRGCDRIVCSPHRAGHTVLAEERVIEIASAELERVLQRDPLQDVVNPEVFQYHGSQVTRPSECPVASSGATVETRMRRVLPRRPEDPTSGR